VKLDQVGLKTQPTLWGAFEGFNGSEGGTTTNSWPEVSTIGKGRGAKKEKSRDPNRSDGPIRKRPTF